MKTEGNVFRVAYCNADFTGKLAVAYDVKCTDGDALRRIWGKNRKGDLFVATKVNAPDLPSVDDSDQPDPVLEDVHSVPKPRDPYDVFLDTAVPSLQCAREDQKLGNMAIVLGNTLLTDAAKQADAIGLHELTRAIKNGHVFMEVTLPHCLARLVLHEGSLVPYTEADQKLFQTPWFEIKQGMDPIKKLLLAFSQSLTEALADPMKRLHAPIQLVLMATDSEKEAAEIIWQSWFAGSAAHTLFDLIALKQGDIRATLNQKPEEAFRFGTEMRWISILRTGVKDGLKAKGKTFKTYYPKGDEKPLCFTLMQRWINLNRGRRG